MNVLWFSNAGQVPTGYGNQTKLFTPLIQKFYGVAVAAFYGAEGFTYHDEHGILHLPRLRDPFMSDVIGEHARYTKSDCVISFVDSWALSAPTFGKLNWCAWSPVDCEPIKPGDLDALQHARWIWAMSLHAVEQFERAGLGDKVTYVPCAVDTTAFSPMDRAEAREKMGRAWGKNLEDKFLVVMNAANKGVPGRKGFYEALTAFTAFSKDAPDAMLYIHTDPLGLTQGEEFASIVELTGCDPDKLIFPRLYDYHMGLLNEAYLRACYSAADVYLSTSYGEGFGIPVVEAQACGCPVIVNGFSASKELKFFGWAVESGTDFMPIPGVIQRRPDVREVTRALQAAYQEEWAGETEGIFSRERARLGALDYEYRRVFDTYMKPALERMTVDLERVKMDSARAEAWRKSYLRVEDDHEPI